MTSKINKSSATAEKNRIFAVALIFIYAGFSIYFPGAGFLAYFMTQRFVTTHRKLALITLIAIELAQILTAIGTQFGPIIGHSWPATRA